MQTILFFDIDSTLVENRFSRKAIGTLLTQIAQVSGKSVPDLGRELGEENERRQRENPDDLLTMDWDDIIETIAKRYGATLHERGIDLWNQYASADDVDVLDDVASVLQTFKEAGYTLVIATKGLKKYQDPVLRVSNLAQYFDDILTPDVTGYLKTTPEYFAKYVQDRTNKRFVHIGDHYYDDVICAKRNGFYSVLRAPIKALTEYDAFVRAERILEYQQDIPTFPKASTDVKPDAVVLSLQELPSVIGHLLAD